MVVRREIAKTLAAGGHRVILMEDEQDKKGDDMIQKFDRLLRNRVTDIVLYWPALAKMQTTYDELILLYDRKDFLRRHEIPIWVLHHTAVARLGVRPLEWETEDDLEERTTLLAAQLD